MAFQANAFQNNAFQIYVPTQRGGWLPVESDNARRRRLRRERIEAERKRDEYDQLVRTWRIVNGLPVEPEVEEVAAAPPEPMAPPEPPDPAQMARMAQAFEQANRMAIEADDMEAIMMLVQAAESGDSN